MVSRRLLSCAGAIALASCTTVGPNYALPKAAVINAPNANGAFVSGTAATSAEALPDHWWRLFNDPLLDRLIEAALAANTDLRVADANLERSHALLAAARAGRQVDGTVDATTSYAQRSAEAVLQHVQPPERQIYNAGISISYDLDLFGGIRRGIEAAAADDEAAIAARDLVRVNVAAETARAYVDLCNAGNQIVVLDRLLALQKESLGLTRELIAHGRSPAFEQEREQGTIQGTQARLPQLGARQRNAAFRIATLMGLPPAAFDHSLLACHTPLTLDRPLPVGDGRALLKRRPDIRAAERRLAAATARIGVATAALYPDVKLGASIGSQGATVDLLSPLTNRFAVGPLISWDIRRTAVRARIAEANADTTAKLASFDGTVLTALREVESALDSYAADIGRLQELEAAQAAADSVAVRTRELHKGGKVGGLVALDAERSQILAEEALTAAQADLNGDQIAVFLALGGGWSL